MRRTRAQTSELVLSDDIVMSFSRRADIAKAFPFLRISAPRKTSSCRRCNPKATERIQRKRTIEGVKHTILTMTPAQKRKLKELLRADKLVVYLPSARGISKTVI